MNYKERYTPYPLGVNASIRLTGTQIGGFLAVTSGTITLTDQAGVVLLNALPVTAGQSVFAPILLNNIDGLFACGGGASGTLLT